MWPRRLPRAAVVVTVVVAAVATPAVALSHSSLWAGTTPTATDGSTGVVLPQTNDTDTDTETTVVRVNLTANGDARWTISSRFRLENETERAAFRAMLADLRNGTDPAPRVGYSAETFRVLADRVEAATNRSGMEITDSQWHGEVRNETGVLSLSFTWTAFARTDGDRVVLGDVFAADVGWFDSLSPAQRLVIAPPPDYAVTESPFPIDEEGIISIDGPEDLSPEVTGENVSVVYAPTAGPGPDDPGPMGQDIPLPFVVVGLLVVIVALVAAYLFGRGSSSEPSPDDESASGADPGSGTETGSTPSSGGSADASVTDPDDTPETSPGVTPDAGVDDPGPSATPTDPDPDPDPDSTPAGGTEAGAGTAARPGSGAGEPAEAVEESDPVDEALLSDEERVERLLERNGGRMKQASIVSETGWSNAKVSQLLSSMAEDGRVDKLRIGRENLISLPSEGVLGADGDTGTDRSESGSEGQG